MSMFSTRWSPPRLRMQSWITGSRHKCAINPAALAWHVGSTAFGPVVAVVDAPELPSSTLPSPAVPRRPCWTPSAFCAVHNRSSGRIRRSGSSTVI